MRHDEVDWIGGGSKVVAADVDSTKKENNQCQHSTIVVSYYCVQPRMLNSWHLAMMYSGSFDLLVQDRHAAFSMLGQLLLIQ